MWFARSWPKLLPFKNPGESTTFPQSLSDTYAPFGELCKETGSIELHTKLIDVFKSHNVWNDFNGNHAQA